MNSLSLKCSPELYQDLRRYNIPISVVCRRALVNEVAKAKAVEEYTKSMPAELIEQYAKIGEQKEVNLR